MTRLPVIVGFGGVGPAGRSSFHHAYDRIIWESLDRRRRRTTVTALSSMMNLAFERNGELRAPDGAEIDSPAYAELEAKVANARAISGNLAMPGFTAPKLLWVRENEPAHFESAVLMMLPGDYFAWRLTGHAATTIGTVDTTGILRLEQMQQQFLQHSISGKKINDHYELQNVLQRFKIAYDE